MTPVRSTRILRYACGLALVALGLIVWSLFDPRPIPVIVAMSIGQFIGTLSFAAFLAVVVADIGPRLRATRSPIEPKEDHDDKGEKEERKEPDRES